MIQRKVPEDIQKYKSKITIASFRLTLRQIICGVIAIAVDFILYTLIGSYLKDFDIDSIVGFFIAVDMPIMAFSFSPMGLPMEVYIKDILLPNYLFPRKRKAKSVLVEFKPPKYSDEEKEKREKVYKQLIKEHPEMKAYK